MIDTHAHVLLLANSLLSLDSNALTVTEDQVDWSKLASVVLAGTELSDSLENIKMAKTDPRFKACVGIHPENITNNSQDLEKLVRSNRPSIVAIGECGLDALCAEVQKQQEVFEAQIKLALEFDLPLVIHARKLNDEILEILKKYPKHRGVFHCYTGGKKRINKILELGEWYFGIDGNITYEVGLEEVVREIPKERVLAETDCPYLTPLPHRGEKNYPQYVRFVYEKIAKIWDKSQDEAEKILDGNAKQLFSI